MFFFAGSLSRACQDHLSMKGHDQDTISHYVFCRNIWLAQLMISLVSEHLFITTDIDGCSSTTSHVLTNRIDDNID